ncbi:porin family protein [Porphyromonas asaccharolytica]|uniref:porin family protein n=1 Tax=Porphyromonas asaccharolytica TaxID=28123 RepID=UPI0002FC1E74|nr:porin family protein [Porphyromonas asaccharolytica]
MSDRKIDIERYGAELKFNLLDGYILAPYLLVGGGIQNMKYELPIADKKIEMMKTDHLYFSGALGFKINLAPRIALNLSGNYLGFRTDLLNPYVNLAKASKKVDKHGLALINNFSARAGLSFYLGGYDPRGGNEVSRAYRDFFSNGFRGMVFTIEPSILYVDFNDHSYWNTRDSWFYGGQVGLDFNNTFGVRGFYYQAGKPGKRLDFDFDKERAMYGGYFTGRLNLPRGVTPYVNLGAGYLDAKLSQEATELDKANLHDVVFGMAGVGLEVPLFRYVSVFGSANFIAHPAPGIKTASVTKRSEIVAKNMAYQLGVRFNLGKPARHYEFETVEDEEVQDKVNDMRDKEYREYREYRYYGEDRDDEYVRMTPSEIEDMAQRIIDRNRSKKGHSCQKGNVYRQPNDDALTPLERELVHALIGNSPQYIAQQQMLANQQVKAQNGTTTTTSDLTEQNEKILDRLDAIDRKIETNDARMQQYQATQPATTVVTTPPTHPAYQAPATSSAVTMDSSATPVDNNSKSLIRLNSVGLLVGANIVKPKEENAFGAFAVGVRAFMPISNTKLDFIPEFFVGFGKKTTFGLTGNVVYNFQFKELGNFVPYLGAGVGFYTDTQFGANFLLGTSYKLPELNSAIFLDYGIRTSGRNHSIALGYRFYF